MHCSPKGGSITASGYHVYGLESRRVSHRAYAFDSGLVRAAQVGLLRSRLETLRENIFQINVAKIFHLKGLLDFGSHYGRKILSA